MLHHENTKMKTITIKRNIGRETHFKGTKSIGSNSSKDSPRKNYNSCPKSPKIQINKNTNSKSFLDNSESKILREKLFSGFRIENFNEHQIELLQKHLQNYYSNSILTRNYDEAEKANKYLLSIENYLKTLKRVQTTLTSKNEIDSTIENIDMKWKRKIEKFDFETEKHRIQMKERFEKENNELENLWCNEMPKKYRRASPQLIETLQMEKRYALTHQFAEARKLKEKAEKMREQESKMAQKKLNSDYKIAKSKLKSKQDKELEEYNQKKDEERLILNSERDNEITKAKRIKELQLKKPISPQLSNKNQFKKFVEADTNLDHHFEINEEEILPPLLAPNDEKVQIEEAKEIQMRIIRNRLLKAKLEEK